MVVTNICYIFIYFTCYNFEFISWQLGIILITNNYLIIDRHHIQKDQVFIYLYVYLIIFNNPWWLSARGSGFGVGGHWFESWGHPDITN